MGVRCLNKFIDTRCHNSVSELPLSSLYSKKIVIDTNIYMYKYNENNELIENFYQMLLLFKYYNIIPVFVFDGKINYDKIETINDRNIQKYNAEKEYNIMLKTHDPSEDVMKEQRKKFVRVSKNMFEEIKTLIDYMGYSYFEAPCEADELCAWLCNTNQVYGCMSEDSDMFIYGCKKVFKNLDFQRKTIFMYEYNKILKEINITDVNFKQLCILSGTDYNKYSKGIFYYYKIYKKYFNVKHNLTFYELLNYKKFKLNYNLLFNVYDRYTLNKLLKKHYNMKFKNNKIKHNELTNFLYKYNFILPS